MKTAGLHAVAGLFLCVLCCDAGNAAEGPIVITDFEHSSDKRLVDTQHGAMISDDISSHGRCSLKIQAAEYVNIRTQRLGLSRPHDLLKIDLFNACGTVQQVRAEIFDETSLRGYWYRHVRRYALRPGWNTLSITVARLYRGEKNARRINDAYLDPAKINRIDLAFQSGPGRGFIYIDNIRFEPDAPMPPVEGLLPFDFGPENQAARHGFITSSREEYEPKRGYGWSSDGWPGAVRDYIHPNSLLGDFREARGETFSLRVPDGKYHVRVYYEDHGWWSDQFARFSWRTINMEGKQVYEERLTQEAAAARFYRFADVEPRPTTDLYETYIKNGRYKPKEFDITVSDGKLDVRFDADRAWACRVSALVVWPADQAEAAAEWCAELDRRMHAQFDAGNVYICSAPRGRHITDIPESARKEGFLVFSAGGTTPTGPNYVPSKTELLSALELFCVPGQDTGAAFSFRAEHGGSLKLSTSVPGLGAELNLVQNRIKRKGDGAYTIVPDTLQPTTEVAVRATGTRQFWIEITAPPDTEPGRYKGEVSLKFREKNKIIPVSVDVLPIELSEPSFTFGMFGLMPDNYAAPGALEKVIELLKRHGMSSVADAPLGRVSVEDGRVKVDFTRADEVMKFLKKTGFTLPVDTYGGGLRGLSGAAKKLGVPAEEAFRLAAARLRGHAKIMGWLPVSYSMVDEPQWSDEALERATQRVRQVNAAAPWLLTNGYWSPSAGNRSHRKLMDTLDRTTLGRVTPEAVRYLKSKGKSIGFYSGCSRHEFGLKQWAAASEGLDAHYAWHFYIRYGDPYYDLDAREPDVCMVYYTPTEVRPSLRLKDVRAGAYDFLYLQTLSDALRSARDDTAAEEARQLLDKAAKAGNIYLDRSAPRIADRDAFRRKVAEAILELTKGKKKTGELGLRK